MIRPGSDTVTFKKPGREADRLHKVAAKTPASADVEWCSFQPLSVKDDISNTSFSSATHRCISPAEDAVLACRAEDILTFQGQNYRVRGTKVFRDRYQRVHHVTVYAEEEH